MMPVCAKVRARPSSPVHPDTKEVVMGTLGLTAIQAHVSRRPFAEMSCKSPKYSKHNNGSSFQSFTSRTSILKIGNKLSLPPRLQHEAISLISGLWTQTKQRLYDAPLALSQPLIKRCVFHHAFIARPIFEIRCVLEQNCLHGRCRLHDSFSGRCSIELLPRMSRWGRGRCPSNDGSVDDNGYSCDALGSIMDRLYEDRDGS